MHHYKKKIIDVTSRLWASFTAPRLKRQRKTRIRGCWDRLYDDRILSPLKSIERPRRWLPRCALSASRRCVYGSGESRCPRNSYGMRLWCQSALSFLTLMNGRRKRSSRTRLDGVEPSRRVFLECPLASWRPISVSQKCDASDEIREQFFSPGGSPLFASIKISFECSCSDGQLSVQNS